MTSRKKIIHLLRGTFNQPGLRTLRDGLLRMGYHLDPSLRALSTELGWIKEQAVKQAIEELPAWSWHRLDPLFARIRRSLRAQKVRGQPVWKQGPEYTYYVAGEALNALLPHTDLVGTRCLDLGCGPDNPYGLSAVFFLNGAKACVALDIDTWESERAAEALADVLAQCALEPDKWHRARLTRSQFMERISAFDVEALRNGNLAAGLKKVPLQYISADIHGPLPVEVNSVDVMASRYVLEHFLDMRRAMPALRDMMRPCGIAYHHIDLVDHRALKAMDPPDYTVEYRAAHGIRLPCEFHFWSFLTEPDDNHQGDCNRLRASEFREYFHSFGFEILEEKPVRESLPEGLRKKLSPHFSAMSDDELEICQLDMVVRRK